MTNARKTIEVDTEAAPVLFRVAFHPDEPEFSPPVPTDGAGRTAPPTGVGASLVAHAITDAAAPKSATSVAIGTSKNNSNHEKPTEGPATTPKPTSNPDSDVTSAASSRESDGDSDCVESCKNSPARFSNMPEIAGHIHEIEQIHEVSTVELGKFYQSMEIFTNTDEFDPLELANGKTTPSKNH